MHRCINIFIYIIAIAIAVCSVQYAYAQDMDEELPVLIEPVVEEDTVEQDREDQLLEEELTEQEETNRDNLQNTCELDDNKQEEIAEQIDTIPEETEEQEIIETVEEEIIIDINKNVEPEENTDNENSVKNIIMDINEVQDIELQKDVQNILEINSLPNNTEFIYLVCYGTNATITIEDTDTTIQKDVEESNKTYIKLNKSSDKYILTISPKESGKLHLCTMTDKMYDFYTGMQKAEENNQTNKEENSVTEENDTYEENTPIEEIREEIIQIDTDAEIQDQKTENEAVTEENGNIESDNTTQITPADQDTNNDLNEEQNITEESPQNNDENEKPETADTSVIFIDEAIEENDTDEQDTEAKIITDQETELTEEDPVKEPDITDITETEIYPEEVHPEMIEQTDDIIVEPEEEPIVNYMKVNSKAVTIYAEVGTVPEDTVVVSEQLTPEKTQTLINTFSIDSKEETEDIEPQNIAAKQNITEKDNTNTKRTKTYNGYAAFGISLASGGTKFGSNGRFKVVIKPEDNINIFSQLPEDAKVQSVTYDIYHIHNGIHCEKLSSYNVITDETGDISNITFETQSFSDFVLRYTVEFTYTNPITNIKKEYSIKGGQSVCLSNILNSLNIWDVDLKDSKVYFTNPDLLEIYKKTDNENNICDWNIKSLKPFDTEELLTIVLNDKTMMLIKVTDSMEIEPESQSTVQTTENKEAAKPETRNHNVLILISIIIAAVVLFLIYTYNETSANKK